MEDCGSSLGVFGIVVVVSGGGFEFGKIEGFEDWWVKRRQGEKGSGLV